LLHGRYLIRPATPNDDAKAARALLEPVDFLDTAMPEEIIGRMLTGWQLPPQSGTATLLLALDRPTGAIIGLAHAIPPVQWLMEAGLSRALCLLLARALVELEAVSVADSARGHGLGHQLVDHLIRSYTRQGYEAMLGGIHTQQAAPGPVLRSRRLPCAAARSPARPAITYRPAPLPGGRVDAAPRTPPHAAGDLPCRDTQRSADRQPF
jgi:GNAT superfamily N-acetyltransferase